MERSPSLLSNAELSEQMKSLTVSERCYYPSSYVHTSLGSRMAYQVHNVTLRQSPLALVSYVREGLVYLSRLRSHDLASQNGALRLRRAITRLLQFAIINFASKTPR